MTFFPSPLSLDFLFFLGFCARNTINFFDFHVIVKCLPQLNAQMVVLLLVIICIKASRPSVIWSVRQRLVCFFSPPSLNIE